MLPLVLFKILDSDADTGPTWMNSTQWQTYLQQASTVAAAGHNGGLPIGNN